jgi:hydrogenase large subunit
VDQVYIPDLLAIASFYKGWGFGGGLSSKNFMSYGDMPQRANDYTAPNLLLPRGAVINGDLSKIHEIDMRNPDEIQEFVSHSWYKYADESKGLHPWDGVTEANYQPEGPNFKGTRTKIEALDESAKYSWIKAPRWKGNAMEVGPLSRMVLGYLQPKQYPVIKDTIDGVLKKLDLPVTALFSTLGRTAARGIEALYCADLQVQQFDKLMANLKAGDDSTANVEKWEPSTWPKEAKGVGFTEAPRGALGHWIKIKDTRIDNYQCVVPTTWNGSPRDAKGQIGAFEASLMNTPMAKADQPLEILRTLHSFDPCLACSTHVMSPDGQELSKVTVR